MKIRFFLLADNAPMPDNLPTPTFARYNQFRAWSESERQYLRDKWQMHTSSELAQLLDRSVYSIQREGSQLGLKKTKEAISATLSRLRTFCDKEKLITIRSSNRKRGQRYKWIRVDRGKWVQYHIWLWEQANGSVPKGMVIVFKNRDSMDVRLDNLELITLKEHGLRNSGIHNLADGYVAHTLAWRNPELQEELLKHPDLIELKRTELQLRRAIKSHDNIEPTKTRR